MTDLTPTNLAEAIRSISIDAGKLIMEIYATDFEVRGKDDDSPVTQADEAGERLILAALAELTPDIPIVAEEQAAAGNLPDISGGRFWCVDPLDGTREFVSRNGEFTVNIALVEQGRPTIGVVYAPAIGRMFYSAGPGQAFSQSCDDNGEWSAPLNISTNDADPDAGLIAVGSRSHRTPETDQYLAKLTIKDLTSAGSSLKFCLVAAGEADIYPRLGPTMEWDTAAGHAVLNGAGGRVLEVSDILEDGAELAYGKPGFRNPSFVALYK